jgi:ABC-type multidrug transport system fused ATPase/permease subunit
MSVTLDILATYKTPGPVFSRRMANGPREDLALVVLMAACFIMFLAQWPRLARQSHLTGEELNPLLGGALLGWVFIAPLFFYVVSILSHLVLRMLGKARMAYRTRMALFWALLATSPLILLQGLVAGFIGAGALNNIIGLICFAVFFWFWGAGLRQAGREG